MGSWRRRRKTTRSVKLQCSKVFLRSKVMQTVLVSLMQLFCLESTAEYGTRDKSPALYLTTIITMVNAVWTYTGFGKFPLELPAKQTQSAASLLIGGEKYLPGMKSFKRQRFKKGKHGVNYSLYQSCVAPRLFVQCVRVRRF